MGRVQELSRDVAGLRAEVRALQAAIHRPPLRLRLAVTAADPDTEEYPPAAAVHYWVMPVDGAPSGSGPGAMAEEGAERHAAAPFLAYNLSYPSAHPAEGHVVVIWHWQGAWYFWPTATLAARPFELKTSLEAGGAATAYARAWDDTEQGDVTDTGETFTVWDYIGDRYGSGADDDPYGRGAIGLAVQLPGDPSDRWRVIDLECP